MTSSCCICFLLLSLSVGKGILALEGVQLIELLKQFWDFTSINFNLFWLLVLSPLDILSCCQPLDSAGMLLPDLFILFWNHSKEISLGYFQSCMSLRVKSIYLLINAYFSHMLLGFPVAELLVFGDLWRSEERFPRATLPFPTPAAPRSFGWSGFIPQR